MKCVYGIIAAAVAAVAAPAAGQTGDVAGVEQFLRADIERDGSPDREARYAVAFVDLNGDRRQEAVVHLMSPSMCGRAGCVIYVLTPTASGYRSVGRMTVSNTPIRVLATRSRGWSDLGVSVSGGGRRAGVGRMSFNGSRYPGNPSVAPSAPAAGRILIAEEPEYRNLYR